MTDTAPAVGPGVVRLTTTETVATGQPSWGTTATVWPERGGDGVVRVFVGDARRRVPLLELGHQGEDVEWLRDWLTALATAVASVDR